ncbi:MAG: hypothetical protein R3B13_04385 [Polyangiaceae bacterium]
MRHPTASREIRGSILFVGAVLVLGLLGCKMLSGEYQAECGRGIPAGYTVRCGEQLELKCYCKAGDSCESSVGRECKKQ